jgi:hypothetical protein
LIKFYFVKLYTQSSSASLAAATRTRFRLLVFAFRARLTWFGFLLPPGAVGTVKAPSVEVEFVTPGRWKQEAAAFRRWSTDMLRQNSAVQRFLAYAKILRIKFCA